MTGLAGIDAVYAVRGPGGAHEFRDTALRAELARVGVDMFHSEWVPDSPFLDDYARTLRFDPVGRSRPAFRRLLGHYRAMAIARELGHARVLVVEPDVRFVLDVDLLNKALAGLPEGFRFAKLVWELRSGASLAGVLARPRVAGHWASADGLDVRNATACVWSADGLRWWTGLVERAAAGGAFRRAEWRSADTYQMPEFYSDGASRGYLAAPWLAVSARSADQDAARFCPALQDGLLSSYAV